jgi:hypothetical protein
LLACDVAVVQQLDGLGALGPGTRRSAIRHALLHRYSGILERLHYAAVSGQQTIDTQRAQAEGIVLHLAATLTCLGLAHRVAELARLGAPQGRGQQTREQGHDRDRH